MRQDKDLGILCSYTRGHFDNLNGLCILVCNSVDFQYNFLNMNMTVCFVYYDIQH